MRREKTFQSEIYVKMYIFPEYFEFKKKSTWE